MENGLGETLLLEKNTKEGHILYSTFTGKGFTLNYLLDHKDEFETVLNRTVIDIKQGNDYCSFIVSSVSPKHVLGNTIPWSSSYLASLNRPQYILGKSNKGNVVINLNLSPHILIGGSTGSGKTNLLFLLIGEAYAKGEKVYVMDFKGIDFYAISRFCSRLVTTVPDAVDLLKEICDQISECQEKYKSLFTSSGKARKLFTRRTLIVVDECAMLTDSGTSKEAKQLSATAIDYLNTIARMGRAFGINLVVSTQRPDAQAVPGSIKSNIDCRICGKADATLSTIILGDGEADKKIPKDSQGRFVISNGTESTVFQGFYYDTEKQ